MPRTGPGPCGRSTGSSAPAGSSSLAPDRSRGKIVGTVMTGLLLGILLSRVASGAVGEHLGWRAVFVGAAALVAALVGVTSMRLPSLPPSASASYLVLLRSTATLVVRHPALRRTALGQGLLALAFSGFWSTLALVLAREPFVLGSTVAGSFGLAGAAGAAIAPIAGSLADKRGPMFVLRAGALLTFASFLAMALAPASLVILVLGTIVFDLGTQASLISSQTIVYGLDPAARSRLNSVLVSTMFVGMAIGSAIASRLVERWGLAGVGTLGAIAAALSLALRLRRAPDGTP